MNKLDGTITQSVMDRLYMMESIKVKLNYGFKRYLELSSNSIFDKPDSDRTTELMLIEGSIVFNIIAIYNIAIDCCKIWYASINKTTKVVSVEKLSLEAVKYYTTMIKDQHDSCVMFISSMKDRNMLAHSYGKNSTIRSIIGYYIKHDTDFGLLIEAIDKICDIAGCKGVTFERLGFKHI